MRSVVQPPKPGSLVEAMRAIGYSLETSLADLIDNSIAAEAKNVDVIFEDGRFGDPYIAILDDGLGMDEATLIEAMRHGSSDPRSERATNDLGRFGLGMKTASQAQCRLLTVITKIRGESRIVGAQWDIDLIHRRDSWELQVLSHADLHDQDAHIPSEILDRLKIMESGTAVLWRRLDRLTESLSNDGESLSKRIQETQHYLGLVFHRFIDGPERKVRLQLNSRDIAPHDPFLLKDAPSWKVGEDKINVPIQNGQVATIAYEAYVLPAMTRLSAQNIESLTSSGGLRKGQGFYIYRGGRLLVWGTWFRIVKQQELSKLARIKIDVPNSLDHLWALDIRKSTAVPPEPIRDALRQAVSRVQTQSTRVTTHRGNARTSAASLWRHVQVDGVTFRFEVNTEHPVVDDVRAKIGEAGSQLLDDLLEAVSTALPYSEIYSAMASDQRPTLSAEIPDSALRQAQDRLAQLVKSGSTQQTAIDRIMTEEPFSRYPDLPLKLTIGDRQ